jgi:hypothetical protein
VTAAQYDTMTWWLMLGPWVFIWLPLEVWRLVQRKRREPGTPIPKLISQIMKERGWQMTGLVYVWNGMASHWWWPAEWGAAWAGVLFWLILAAALVFDFLCRKIPVAEYPVWMRWARFPLFWMVAGLLGGRFLFPQASRLPWEW